MSNHENPVSTARTIPTTHGELSVIGKRRRTAWRAVTKRNHADARSSLQTFRSQSGMDMKFISYDNSNLPQLLLPIAHPQYPHMDSPYRYSLSTKAPFGAHVQTAHRVQGLSPVNGKFWFPQSYPRFNTNKFKTARLTFQYFGLSQMFIDIP
jgi:hypothetical protein